jgi:hypothetical protein
MKLAGLTTLFSNVPTNVFEREYSQTVLSSQESCRTHHVTAPRKKMTLLPPIEDLLGQEKCASYAELLRKTA